MNKSVVLFFLSVCLSCVFSGCMSIKQPKEVFALPDYTEDDVKENEKKRIEQLSKDTPVQALWRAVLLGDEETVSRYEDNLIELLKKAVAEEDYYND